MHLGGRERKRSNMNSKFQMKKAAEVLLLSILHLIAIGLIIYAFLPIAEWYFQNPTLPASNLFDEAKPLWGVDFYYTASIVSLLRDNIVLPPSGWGYAWFTGWPILSNYPILTYYLILPFTFFYPLIASIKLWMVISLGFYIIGIYACCYIVSRNIILSASIAIAGIYSIGVYGALMWGGSLPNHATQAFLPWTLFFIILYLQRQAIRYLFFSAIVAGFAIWSHPQIVIAYIYPSSLILIFFWFLGPRFIQRIKAILIFLSISFAIALPFSYPFLGSILDVFIVKDSYNIASSTVAGAPSKVAKEIIAFHRAQPYRIFTDSNTTLFLVLGICLAFYLIILLFKNRIRSLLYVAPFLVLALYFVVYIWMFAYGISIFHGGWYRLFWVIPLGVGLLAASFWGAAQKSFLDILNKFRLGFFSLLIISIGIGLIGYFSINSSWDVYDRIIARSTPSSAFPDKLNMRNEQKSFESLKTELVPEWLNTNNTNYRLYVADQTINIWWNSFYKMPLARGYLDPLFPDAGYVFLVDASLNQDLATGKDQLAGSFKYPDEIAFNNTLFLVDWYAIKYFEAGPTAAAYNPLPKSLTNETYIAREQEFNFNTERYTKTNQVLHYYELKDEFVAPILSATNAKTLGIIASDRGYETVIRGIADMNMSSKQFIPIKLGQYIDKLKTSDVSAMDALIVYDYNYSNKGNAYRLLTDFVKKGKKVFIDTGVEVKEASTPDTLPEIFPIEKTIRKPLGTTWDFEIADKTLTQGANFTKFDPPLFDAAPWNISYPPQKEDIRDGTNIILKNHGIPVMISQTVGDGQVIWSGINLPYHAIRSHNVEEVRFFKNIIEKLLEGAAIEEPTYEAKFINPQKRQIVFHHATGVLFKEQSFPGWGAKIGFGSPSQGLKIYKVGPANPGFMYVRVPTKYAQKETTIAFTYSGSFTTWFLSIISFLIIVFLLEEILIGGRIIGRLRRLAWKRAHGRVKSWWGREDE